MNEGKIAQCLQIKGKNSSTALPFLAEDVCTLSRCTTLLKVGQQPGKEKGGKPLSPSF